MENEIYRPKITGLVVCYNEGKYLKRCLESIKFCDELLVIDLGSTDNSVKVAKNNGAIVLHHNLVPAQEYVRSFAYNHSKHDWILQLDPDEKMDPILIPQIFKILKNDNNYGIIELPWQFYFKNKPLKYTVWGGENKYKAALVNKKRIIPVEYVHRKNKLIQGFTEIRIKRKGNNCIHHYWMNSYKTFFKKHWRYIKKEGEIKYSFGERFSVKALFIRPIQALKNNLLNLGGLKGDTTEVLLSFFYSLYIFLSYVSLGIYQIFHKINKK